MNTIEATFQLAQLAEAAYAVFTDADGDVLIPSQISAALQGDDGNGMTFSAAQAAAFVAEWTVVDQYTVSGLFHDKGDGGNKICSLGTYSQLS